MPPLTSESYEEQQFDTDAKMSVVLLLREKDLLLEYLHTEYICAMAIADLFAAPVPCRTVK